SRTASRWGATSSTPTSSRSAGLWTAGGRCNESTNRPARGPTGARASPKEECMRGLVMAGSVFLAGMLCFSTAAVAEEPLAKVGDKVFTRADIEELFKLEATSRKITPEQLEKDEIDAKVPTPADADIQKVYDENKEELQGQSLDQVKPQIIEYLKGEKEQVRRAAFIEELKKKYKTTDSLKAPVVEVATAGRPERGGGAKA